jgi:hypothetical protein
MSFLREGILNVRAVVLPDGIGADGRLAAVSRTALVTWQSTVKGMLFQVYANGRLAGATIHPDERQMVVQTPASFEAAVRIEVIAVRPSQSHMDFADQLEKDRSQAHPRNARVKLTLLRSQRLPIGGSLNIYSDAGSGEIDYGRPLNASPIPIWSCRQDKAGFGMATFGAGDFGWDSAACVGFGKGRFALGEFGMDADAFEWISPVLTAGRFRFGVVVTDEQGNVSPPSETSAVAVMPPARPAATLGIAGFDHRSNHLTLTISDHT